MELKYLLPAIPLLLFSSCARPKSMSPKELSDAMKLIEMVNMIQHIQPKEAPPVKIIETSTSTAAQRNEAAAVYARSPVARQPVKPGESPYVAVKTRDGISRKEGLIIIDRSTGKPLTDKIRFPEVAPESGAVTRIEDKDCIIL